MPCCREAMTLQPLAMISHSPCWGLDYSAWWERIFYKHGVIYPLAGITVIYARLIWSHACQEIGSVRLAKCTYRGGNPLSSGNQTHQHYPHSLIAIGQIKVKTGFGHNTVFFKSQCIVSRWFRIPTHPSSHNNSVSSLSTNSYSVICISVCEWVIH